MSGGGMRRGSDGSRPRSRGVGRDESEGGVSFLAAASLSRREEVSSAALGPF